MVGRRHAPGARRRSAARPTRAGRPSTFASPVAVTAGTTYVASYFAPNGPLLDDVASGLDAAVDNPPLHALANSTSANGVYAYGAASTFPSSSYNATNYWVDVLYALPRARARSTGVTAAEGGPTLGERLVVGARERRPGDLLQDHPVRRRDRADADDGQRHARRRPRRQITGLTTGTTYTFTVQALNANGAGPASAQSNAVTPHGGGGAHGADRRDRAAGDAVRAGQLDGARRSDGDSPITGYTVTPYVGATAQTPVAVSARRRPARRSRGSTTAAPTRSGSRRPTPSARARRRPPPAR